MRSAGDNGQDSHEQSYDEQAFADSREVLYRIFEYAPDAVILVNGSGRIVKANAQAERMFGYRREELIGQLVEILIPERLRVRHVGYRSGYVGTPHARPMGMGLELFGRRKDNTEFPVDIMLSPLEVDEHPLVLGVVRDATERKRIEEVAREAREMYIKEVHHRVKNNLQVISSLLFLQSTHSTDPNILEILNESRGRVKSIALVHEKLYRTSEAVRLDFAEYVRDLVADLFRAYCVGQKGIRVTTEVNDVYLEVETATSCGLIINELVANALKHAFVGRESGELLVKLESRDAGELVLTVRDDGIGFPDGFDPQASTSLGLRLVVDLTRQLDGTVEVEHGGGTTFHVRFHELHYTERN